MLEEAPCFKIFRSVPCSALLRPAQLLKATIRSATVPPGPTISRPASVRGRRPPSVLAVLKELFQPFTGEVPVDVGRVGGPSTCQLVVVLCHEDGIVVVAPYGIFHRRLCSRNAGMRLGRCGWSVTGMCMEGKRKFKLKSF